MKVAIVGSRNYARLDRVRAYVDSLPLDTEVVSGGAEGVDRAAADAANAREMFVTVFPADWAKHGKRAGYIRNVEIVKHVDAVVAFWDGRSKGTAMTIALAHQRGIPVTVKVISEALKP